jgi:hypothetical protein
MVFPKQKSSHRGYYFDVTDDQIKEHLARSCKDIFQWLETTNRFVYQIQTPKERLKSRLSKVS